MNKAELIAKQLANANVNKKAWDDILFNVRVYGAQGDGTIDESDSISRAISVTSPLGGYIFFPPGTYRISKNLTIPRNVTVFPFLRARN